MEESRHNRNTDHSQQQSVDQSEKKSPGGRLVGFFLLGSSQVISNHCIDPHAEADGYGADEILDRIDQGQSGHCVFADLCYEKAVYDIIQGIYQHRDHHRKTHRHDQWKYGFFFHKSFIHLSVAPYNAYNDVCRRSAGKRNAT